MYFIAVVLFMFVCPLTSVVIEASRGHQPLWNMVIIGKWWVFWTVGIRLFIAGIRQVVQPGFTSQKIFEVHDPNALPLVREIGFANLSMGAVGVLCLFRREWIIPIAIVGGLYFGLATIGHLPQKKKNPREYLAMISDAFASFVLLAFAFANR
jgi:hypothetical protein